MSDEFLRSTTRRPAPRHREATRLHVVHVRAARSPWSHAGRAHARVVGIGSQVSVRPISCSPKSSRAGPGSRSTTPACTPSVTTSRGPCNRACSRLRSPRFPARRSPPGTGRGRRQRGRRRLLPRVPGRPGGVVVRDRRRERQGTRGRRDRRPRAPHVARARAPRAVAAPAAHRAARHVAARRRARRVLHGVLRAAPAQRCPATPPGSRSPAEDIRLRSSGGPTTPSRSRRVPVRSSDCP